MLTGCTSRNYGKGNIYIFSSLIALPRTRQRQARQLESRMSLKSPFISANPLTVTTLPFFHHYPKNICIYSIAYTQKALVRCVWACFCISPCLLVYVYVYGFFSNMFFTSSFQRQQSRCAFICMCVLCALARKAEWLTDLLILETGCVMECFFSP